MIEMTRIQKTKTLMAILKGNHQIKTIVKKLRSIGCDASLEVGTYYSDTLSSNGKYATTREEKTYKRVIVKELKLDLQDNNYVGLSLANEVRSALRSKGILEMLNNIED